VLIIEHICIRWYSGHVIQIVYVVFAINAATLYDLSHKITSKWGRPLNLIITVIKTVNSP